MIVVECEEPRTEDGSSVLDDDVVLQHRCHQQQQLKEQLKRTCDREMTVTRQLETANKTIEDLREQLDDLQTAKQKETEFQQQLEDNSGIHTDRSDAVALLELKAPVGDMLYAFLSYTLTSNQQLPLLDLSLIHI